MDSRDSKTTPTIWIFALGYFAFYIPYSALTKALSSGSLPGTKGTISGFELLPATVIATAITVLLFISIMGWWKYAGRREILGISVPFPGFWTGLSGLSTAMIIATTTLAYTFSGVSIVLALVLMRGGVLSLAPVVDFLFKRRVHWYSWGALVLSFTAVAVALADTAHYALTIVAVLNLAAYLAGYLFRLQFMTRVAKSDDRSVNLRYFVEEQMVSMPALLLVLALFAMIGVNDAMIDLRRGFTTFLASDIAGTALLIGFFYGCLFVFGSLIYLDQRENSFCIPLNRCSSLLAGIFASSLLTVLLGHDQVSGFQLTSAAIIVVTLLFLGFPSLIASQRVSFVRLSRNLPKRLLLFVCTGNTNRSPLAKVICQAEIAKRLGVLPETLDNGGLRIQSAGLSAQPGAPMTSEARQTLRELGIHNLFHAACNVTEEMVCEAEAIFCMTRDQRETIIAKFPFAMPKTHCLDPQGDIEDPSGRRAEAFRDCAQRIQRVIPHRLAELGLNVA